MRQRLGPAHARTTTSPRMSSVKQPKHPIRTYEIGQRSTYIKFGRGRHGFNVIRGVAVRKRGLLKDRGFPRLRVKLRLLLEPCARPHVYAA